MNAQDLVGFLIPRYSWFNHFVENVKQNEIIGTMAPTKQGFDGQFEMYTSTRLVQ